MNKPASKIAREIAVRQANDQTIFTADIMLYGHVDGNFPLRIHCECSRPECDELLEVTKGKVSATHAVSSDFLVLPDHFDAAVEDIHEKNRTYWVVRKHDSGLVDQVEEVVDTLNLTPEVLEDLGSAPNMIRAFNRLVAAYTRKGARQA